MKCTGMTLRPRDEESVLERAWTSTCSGAEARALIVLVGGKQAYDGGGPAVEYRFKNGVLQ